MHRSAMSRRHAALASLALGALVALLAACGSGPGASSPPSSAGGGSPSASRSAGPSGGSSADPLLGIRIGPPYSLADLPAAQADKIQTQIQKDLGVYGGSVHVTMKAVNQGALNAAYLMVVAFPQGTLDEKLYEEVLHVLSTGAGSPFAPRLVVATPVSFGTLGGGSAAVFKTGDLVLITLSPAAADLTPVVTALVRANG